MAVYSPTFAADLTALETGASSSQPQLLLVDIMTRLKAMGYLTLSVRIAGMVSLGLLMFRTLSSLRFHPHLNMVTATLTASLHSLVPFCCIFVICLTAFVTSGCLLFGERLLQFSTISRSIITVVNMLFGQFDLAAIFAVDYNIAFTWYWCAMVILFLVLFNMLLAIVLAAFDHVRTVTATKIAPYMAAITELRRLAGPMLWPWNHPHMMQLGSFAESANTGLSTAVTSASIAKQLCVTDVDADIVLRKTRAFLAIMHILRDSNLNDDDVDGEDFVGEGEVAPTSVDVSELNQRLDMMEARLEAKLAAMSVNMAALIARIDAKL
ncbi:hypothetical protein DYB34_004626 [Aphanomyces astaci]|nr:hypothetical protein DYB34_004626 [Aphanomyces astaci]